MIKSEAIKRATNIYRENLLQYSNALNYINNRGINDKTLERFKVGYAWGNLVATVSRVEGWFDEATKYGLVRPSGVDFFEGFITFPVFNKGEYTNMTSRKIIGDGPPHKSLPNSQKGIYNIGALDSGAVLLVESPIDCLTLIQAGYSVCASFGTKITSASAPNFKGVICYVIYDADSAGETGALKTAKIISRHTKKTYIVKLPAAKGEKVDVNEYFQRVKFPKLRLDFLLKNSLAIQPHEFKALNEAQTKKIKEMQDWEENRLDISIVGRVLFRSEQIRDGGHVLWVTCPHHSGGTEENKSLWIGGNKNMFYCFGCLKGGGPVYMVSWHLKCSSEEAREWIRKNVQP